MLLGGLSARGAPVARIGGQDYEVFGAIPGERVDVALETHGRATRVALLGLRAASDTRVAPRCAHAAECGGCDWQHIRYDAQLGLKHASVRSLLERALGAPPVVEPTLPTPGPDGDAEGAPWGFRDKVHFVFGGAVGAPLVMGHYRRGTRSVVPVSECPVHAPRGNATAFALRDILADLGIPGASPDGAGGVARHVIVRVGHATGERLATFVVTRRDDKRLRVASRRLLAAPGAPDGLYLNVHDKPGPWLFGRDTVHVHGRTRLREDVGGVAFLVSPTSFFQTNVSAAATLVGLVSRAVADAGAARVLDLYAGAGLFALPLAQSGLEVVAVEENGDAVDAGVASRAFSRVDARACTFVSARAEEFVAGRARGADPRFSPDVVVLDPPRDGCPEPVLKGVLERWRPRALIYVSCNPVSLARDLAALAKARLVATAHAPYRLTTVQPLDMFPHTPHVEVVATLARR